ncbi:hypothetical protein L2E82_25016 [Cichorium intybus]|uniref:Uncharacterized protein n=1 Tax=Cichorium intybus TaxID=13427 RepID=A0ACB9E327_CICIN|nr:hypothetical protein L2E82_25016 [Cichorium intybus]
MVINVRKRMHLLKSLSEQDKEPEHEVAAEISSSGPSEESTVEIPLEIDEYELVDHVDILTPLEKSVFRNGEWSEQKEVVAELTKLALTKKIAPGDFIEICRTLKKLIIYSKLAVAIEAVQAIESLASGLRTNLSRSLRLLLPVLLEKLKEKKPTMTVALSNTLKSNAQSWMSDSC